MTVPAEADIRAVMQKLGGTDGPLGVMENGTLIGQISKDRVLRKLIDPQSG